jgi:hypothetical protein
MLIIKEASENTNFQNEMEVLHMIKKLRFEKNLFTLLHDSYGEWDEATFDDYKIVIEHESTGFKPSEAELKALDTLRDAMYSNGMPLEIGILTDRLDFTVFYRDEWLFHIVSVGDIVMSSSYFENDEYALSEFVIKASLI